MIRIQIGLWYKEILSDFLIFSLNNLYGQCKKHDILAMCMWLPNYFYLSWEDNNMSLMWTNTQMLEMKGWC